MHHPRFGAGEFLVLALIAFFAFLFFVYPWWRIFSKAGYPGVLSLLYFCMGEGSRWSHGVGHMSEAQYSGLRADGARPPRTCTNTMSMQVVESRMAAASTAR